MTMPRFNIDLPITATFYVRGVRAVDEDAAVAAVIERFKDATVTITAPDGTSVTITKRFGWWDMSDDVTAVLPADSYMYERP